MSSASVAPVPRAQPDSAARREPAYQVREVLFATDLAPESERAFEHARLLAERFQARLTLYHAVEFPDPVYVHWGFNRSHAVWLEIEKSARQQLQHKAATLGVSHAVEVERVSSPQRSLMALIRKQQPDLVVMATHGRGGLSHMLMGSVTEYVFQHAFRPVLCVREPEHGGPLPYRRILVPTDLSLASRLAFPIAASFAQQFSAGVLALHVSGHPGHAPQPVPSEAWLSEFVRPDFPGVEIGARLEHGPVWQRIVETAKAEKADLIVMSTRGHHNLSDRVMGSNTERVVRHAPCPVLVA